MRIVPIILMKCALKKTKMTDRPNSTDADADTFIRNLYAVVDYRNVVIQHSYWKHHTGRVLPYTVHISCVNECLDVDEEDSLVKLCLSI